MVEPLQAEYGNTDVAADKRSSSVSSLKHLDMWSTAIKKALTALQRVLNMHWGHLNIAEGNDAHTAECSAIDKVIQDLIKGRLQGGFWKLQILCCMCDTQKSDSWECAQTGQA